MPSCRQTQANAALAVKAKDVLPETAIFIGFKFKRDESAVEQVIPKADD
jgi:hypothetical protein